MALEVLSSLWANCLLVVIKYVLKSRASFNNWPMVMIILLSSICCPISFVTFKIIGVSSTFGCSTTDGNLVHLMDQDGSRAVVTSYGGSYNFSSFYNSWTISIAWNFLPLTNLGVLFPWKVPSLGRLPLQMLYSLWWQPSPCYNNLLILFSLNPPVDLWSCVFSSPSLEFPLSIGNSWKHVLVRKCSK